MNQELMAILNASEREQLRFLSRAATLYGMQVGPKEAQAIAEQLTSAIPMVRLLFANILARSGDERGVDVLISCTRDPDPQICTEAASLLAGLPELHVRGVPAICTLLHREPSLRHCAISCLRSLAEGHKIDVSAATPLLRACLACDDEELIISTMGLIRVLPETLNFNVELKSLRKHPHPEISQTASWLRKERRSCFES